MTGWLWGIGGLAAIIAGWFLKGKLGTWPILGRRKKTIEKEIKELDEQKEEADEDIEARRKAALDADPFN